MLRIPIVERELLSDKVASVLRHMIMTGELPAGTRLVEDELAGQLGVSRAPLREALGLLTHEGLVHGQPGKGISVRDLTPEGVRNVFAVRTILEIYAAELAAARIQPGEISQLQCLADRMESNVSTLNVADYVSQGMEIHRLIWQFSGNERLSAILETLVLPLGILFQMNAESYDDWLEVISLHRAIIDAIASNKDGGVAEAIRRHMDDAVRKALAALEKRPGVEAMLQT